MRGVPFCSLWPPTPSFFSASAPWFSRATFLLLAGWGIALRLCLYRGPFPPVSPESGSRTRCHLLLWLLPLTYPPYSSSLTALSVWLGINTGSWEVRQQSLDQPHLSPGLSITSHLEFLSQSSPFVYTKLLPPFPASPPFILVLAHRSLPELMISL